MYHSNVMFAWWVSKEGGGEECLDAKSRQFDHVLLSSPPFKPPFPFPHTPRSPQNKVWWSTVTINRKKCHSVTTGSKHDGVGFFPFGLVRGLTHERCEHKKFSAPMLTSFVSDHIVLPPDTQRHRENYVMLFWMCPGISKHLRSFCC